MERRLAPRQEPGTKQSELRFFLLKISEWSVTYEVQWLGYGLDFVGRFRSQLA